MADTSTVVRLGRKVGWSFGAKLVSAALQLAVIVILARGLPPREFAWVATINVVMVVVVATNGFGMLRQFQLRRISDPNDPTLPGMFNVWQMFIVASAALWAATSVVLWWATKEPDFLAILPIALWLVFEQTTSVWNGISLADGNPQHLLSSYLYRRVPVVLLLAVGLAAEWDLVWSWSIGLASGALLAYLRGASRQEPWARRAVPRRRRPGEEVVLDLGFWWAAVGVEVRELDVGAITAISATTGGIYALPARLIKPMNLVTISMVSIAFPELARRRVVSTRQLMIGCTVGSAPAALVAGGLAASAGLLPLVVGEDYRAAVPVLRVLCLAAVLTAFGGLVATFIQTRTDAATRYTGYCILIFGLLQIATAASAAYLSGATAAAWAASATQATLVGVLLARALRECGDRGESPGRGDQAG